MARKKFIVEIDIPERATVDDVRQYIHDAVSSWCGQFEPPGGAGLVRRSAVAHRQDSESQAAL